MKIKNKIYFIFGITAFLMLVNCNSVLAYSIDYKGENNNLQVIEDNSPEVTMGPDWYTKPTNYGQLVQWYKDLEEQYPDYIEVFKANELYDTGQATGGYDLYYVRITNESLGLNKPEVLFIGGPHGDETVGTIGMFWFTDWLMRMAFTDETNQEFTKDYLQWIIDNREIYLEVSHNPWGFDHGPQRYDSNGWDLNREADYDGPGTPAQIWGSNNGKTLRAFIDNHVIRAACDFHGGARLLLYPWGSNHANVIGKSLVTGYTYNYAPPDFYFFDASSLRLGDYMGDYGGNLDQYSIGTIPGTVGYVVKGGIAPWAYGADVEKNSVEDPFVQDEIWGNYPGAGVLWISPEMSNTKNPAENTFGNDTNPRYGAEVRRFILHQTDLVQPSVRWQPGTAENNIVVDPGTTLGFNWQVNGSLVVDHTFIQWGSNPDPISFPTDNTDDYDEHAGDSYGGTGWDNAESGKTSGVTYSESITLYEPGEYYFVSKAQVDQVYGTVLHPEIYGDNPYLRLIKERTNDEYYEVLEGTDGTEEIFGHSWWYSDIIHITVPGSPPEQPSKPSGTARGKPGTEYTFTTRAVDPDNQQVFYKWSWGDGIESDWLGPFDSGVTASASHTWSEDGKCSIKVKAKDIQNQESDWSEPASINIPRYQQSINPILSKILDKFPIINRLIYSIKSLIISYDLNLT
jgi:hypothetical protein